MFFGAHWCGYTKRAKPHWEKLMDELKAKGDCNTPIYQLECGNEPVCQDFGVHSTPTIRYYRDSAKNYTQFNQPDEYEYMKNFVTTCWKK